MRTLDLECSLAPSRSRVSHPMSHFAMLNIASYCPCTVGVQYMPTIEQRQKQLPQQSIVCQEQF